MAESFRARLFWGVFVLLLCLSISLAASAATIAPVPENRVDVGSESGLSMTHTYKEDDAHLTLRVNVADTDWQKVLLYAPGIDNEGMLRAYNLVIPMERANAEDAFTLCVRWFDGNDMELCTEKLVYTVEPSSTDALTVSLPPLDANLFVTDLNPSPVLSSCTVKSRTLTCVVDSESYAGDVRIGVRMPAGATKVRCVSGNLDFSNPIQNGCAVLSLPFDARNPSRRRQVLEWLDASDTPIELTSLFIVLRPKVLHPWTYYVTDWQGIPQSRLVVQNPAASFIDAQYEDKQNYMLNITYSGKNPAKEPSENNFCISVRAPEGAVAYRKITMSSDNIMSWNEENFFWQNDSVREQSPQRTQPNEVVVLSEWPLFSTFHFSDTGFQSKLSAFLPQHSWQDELGGEINIIYWYDSLDPDAEPFLCEYTCNHIAPFLITTQQAAIRQPVSHRLAIPVILVDARESRNLTLVISMYPQLGFRAIRYELHLEDEFGMKVKPPLGSFIYLPYPDGCSFSDNIQFTLYHYDEDGNSVRMTPEKTAYGLRFQTDHFSPFVLSWSADAAPSASPIPIPKTGDATPLNLLWGSLLLFGCLTMLFFLRRQKA